MCQDLNHVVLTETEKAQVSWCKGCKNYSVLYNGCCLSFTEKEIAQFKDILHQLSDEDYHYNFLHDHYALIKHNGCNMGIAINREDTQQLIMIIHEATSIKEVFGIIYN